MMDQEIKTLLETEKTPEISRGFFRWVSIIIFVIIIGCGWLAYSISRAPRDFKTDVIITVYSGMTIKDLGSVLESNNIVMSGTWFHGVMSTRFKDRSIIAGDYIFEKPQSVFSVAYRIANGVYGNSRIKVTFPEGITRHAMADIVSQKIPEFPRDEFLQKTYAMEGFLFPDTYYFFRTQSVDQIITSLQVQWQERMKSFTDSFVQTELFDEKTLTLQSYGGNVRTMRDIIIMASILEREANNAQEAKIVSGILWKRMAKKMPLQVDATFKYTIGKTSSELTITDLRQDNSYNTYTRTGLPIGPIGNPGKDMIDAALHPVESDYWYYLHDNQGTIYYGKTYQEHLKNKEKYLK
jgi:UPF0755 protein